MEEKGLKAYAKKYRLTDSEFALFKHAVVTRKMKKIRAVAYSIGITSATQRVPEKKLIEKIENKKRIQISRKNGSKCKKPLSSEERKLKRKLETERQRGLYGEVPEHQRHEGTRNSVWTTSHGFHN